MLKWEIELEICNQGEEITDNYGCFYQMSPMEERRYTAVSAKYDTAYVTYYLVSKD